MTSPRVPVGAAVPSLVRWGLSADADLVFRTLVTFGPRTERVLAVELGLATRRTTDALGELSENGAAHSTGDARGTARVWKARRPAHVIERLRLRRMRLIAPETRVRSHYGVFDALRTSGLLAALPPRTLPALPGEFAAGIRYLDSRATGRRRLAEVLDAGVGRFWSMSTDQAIDAESARAAAPMDEGLLKRGARIRLLRPPTADGDTLDVSGHLVDGRAYQRYEFSEVPLKMMLADHRVAFIPADPRDVERGYLEVADPAVLTALTALYDRTWNAAATRRNESVSPIRLSDRERDLITLLAAGHTDRTAAEHLRLSPRSVTSVLRALMDRLGVENRFQLGLALGTLRVAAPSAITDPES